MGGLNQSTNQPRFFASKEPMVCSKFYEETCGNHDVYTIRNRTFSRPYPILLVLTPDAEPSRQGGQQPWSWWRFLMVLSI